MLYQININFKQIFLPLFSLFFIGCANNTPTPKVKPTKIVDLNNSKKLPNPFFINIDKNLEPYYANGKYYKPYIPLIGEKQQGIANWYGKVFNNKITASGEVFDMYKFTAGHRLFPFDTVLKVTNLKNGKSIQVKINDRGPFDENKIIDLSFGSALKLDLIKEVNPKVKIEVLQTPYESAEISLNEIGKIKKEKIKTLKEIKIKESNKLNGSNSDFILYKIKKGDTLEKIAKKLGSSKNKIKKKNSLKSNSLKIGRKILIPLIKKADFTEKGDIIYTVKEGDTLSKISLIYNVRIVNIKKINKLKTNRLNIGDKIVIPK